MRRIPRPTAAAIAIACSLLGVAGCSASGDDKTSARGGEKHYTIGFSNPTAAQPILQTFQASLTAAGKRLNIDVKSLDAQLDANKQVTDINQFVAQHVDAIIVFPLSQDSLTPALNRARQEGIKVIGFNAVLEPPKGDIAPYDTNFDQGEDFQGAQLLADYVGKQLGGKGNVLGIGIGFPVPSLHFMMDNYRKFVTAANPNVSWADTVSNPTDDIAGGQKVTADAITKYEGDIQAVMSYNTASAMGAAVAFKNASIKQPIIVGQNGDPQSIEAIKNGSLSAVVDIVPWREALVGITLTKKLLDGDDVPNWIATPVELYTKDNVDKRLDWDEAVSQIKAGTLSCASGGGCPAELSGP